MKDIIYDINFGSTLIFYQLASGEVVSEMFQLDERGYERRRNKYYRLKNNITNRMAHNI